MKLATIIISTLFASASVGINAQKINLGPPSSDVAAPAERKKTKIDLANEARKERAKARREMAEAMGRMEAPSEVPEEGFDEELNDASPTGMGRNKALRNLGGRGECHWQDEWYDENDWAYDCDADYDKCQCKCDSDGDCRWKNCKNDKNYCNGGGGWECDGCEWNEDCYDEGDWRGNKICECDWRGRNCDWTSGGGGWDWDKNEDYACRVRGSDQGREGRDYKKYPGKSKSWCKNKCEDDSDCKGFEYSYNGCEIWWNWYGNVQRKDGFICYWKVRQGGAPW